jgi:hypothetical protein
MISCQRMVAKAMAITAFRPDSKIHGLPGAAVRTSICSRRRSSKRIPLKSVRPPGEVVLDGIVQAKNGAFLREPRSASKLLQSRKVTS